MNLDRPLIFFNCGPVSIVNCVFNKNLGFKGTAVAVCINSTMHMTGCYFDGVENV